VPVCAVKFAVEVFTENDPNVLASETVLAINRPDPAVDPTSVSKLIVLLKTVPLVVMFPFKVWMVTVLPKIPASVVMLPGELDKVCLQINTATEYGAGAGYVSPHSILGMFRKFQRSQS